MEKKDVVRTMVNIASPVASVASMLNPAFLLIPITSGVYNEVCGWMDAKSTEKRLHQLEVALQELGISIDSFREGVDKLEEHDQYVARNNIKHLCVSALPEVTDMLIDSIIDYIMNDEQPHEMQEEILEILRDFNANDIQLMGLIKNYREKQLENDKKVMPITWDEFANHCLGISNSTPIDAAELMDNRIVAEDGSEEYKFAYYVRSLLKMQRLGVVNIYVPTTLGNISQNSIEKFAVTVFGEKLLEHIR